MSGSNDGSAGTLNNLLKYRFTKKPASKLYHLESLSDEQQNGLCRENSVNSIDSQATILYGSQQCLDTSQQSSDSQATITSSQATVSPAYGRTAKMSADVKNAPQRPVLSSTLSPVFKSKISQKQEAVIIVDSDSPHGSDSPLGGDSPLRDDSPLRGHVKQENANGASNCGTAGVSSVQKSQNNTKPLSRDTVDQVNKEDFQRLRGMFPGSSENRIRAALIVYPRDFQKAIQFMNSEQSKQGEKRPAPSSDSDDVLEITGPYKRIKVLPKTPSPTRVVSIDLLNDSSSPKIKEDDQNSDASQKGLDFLRGCFPAKSLDDLRAALVANDGDTQMAVASLSADGSSDSKLAESLNQKAAGPSSDTKAGKSSSALRPQVAASKVKKKREKIIEISDEDDDYDEYDDSGDSDDSEDLGSRSKSETDNFLQFFDEATLEELTAMPGCSKKKALVIMELRPFKTWENLIERFNTEKQLSTSLISGCKEIMQVRNTIRRLMVRCESISQQMGLVVSRLTKQNGASGGEELRITKPPELLNKEFELQPYQFIGLSWLRIMHEQKLNGILADEMGLGKTIQAIAFLAHLMEEGEEGPHVIIVPSSTIENWLRELQLWCPALKIVVYYGSQEERRAVRHSIFFQGEEFNVLLTTYNMATGGVEDRVLFKKFEFHYAVFDEGHMLKNMSSLRFQNLMKIAAERRLLLTGTPLQNNLLELMSLLCFVMPEIFQGKTDHLKKVFAMISRSEDKQKSRFERDRIAQAKRIMKPFVLRRLKRDVLQNLPKKIENIVKCTLTPVQQELYERLVAKYSQEIGSDNEETASSGGVGIFMQFRKAANHPLLLRNLYTDEKLEKMATEIAKEPSHRDRGALPHLIQEDMSVMNDYELLALCKQYKKYLGQYILDTTVIADSAKFRQLDTLLPQLKEKDDRVLMFSQFTMMLDIMEMYLQQKGYKYIRMDGQTPVPDRLQLIDRFNNEADIFIFLLSTRAGGLGINLVAANTIILHDIDFNPYNDKQAEDRCHRLGQKREVTIYKMICEDTVDEAMLKCANDKLDLEKDLTEPTQDDETEESAKDVAHMLKDVLRLRQKKKEGSTSEETENSTSEGTKNSSSAVPQTS